MESKFACLNLENAVRKNLGIYKSRLKFWAKKKNLSLNQMLNLKYFYFDSYKKITSLSGIEDASNLTSFTLSFYSGAIFPTQQGDAQISSFKPLKKLKNLKVFQLAEHSNVDLDCLANLPLQMLSLPKCFIKDITAISNIKSLKILSLHGNQIENLEPLSNLKNLQILNLSFNNIRDVSPLNKLENLKIVHLVENPVKNWNSITSLNEPGRNTKVIKNVESSMLAQEYLVRFFSKRLYSNVSDSEFLQLTAGNAQYYRNNLSKNERAEFDSLDNLRQRFRATYMMGGIHFLDVPSKL